MDDQFDSIMNRIRARQTELTGEEAKENVVQSRKPVLKQEDPAPPAKVFGLSSNASEKSPVNFRQPAPKESTPNCSSTFHDTENSENQSSTTKKPSRFSMLAQEIDDYEYDYQSQYNKPKEAFMKGRSPRMSIGETRSSVLNTPAGAASLRSPNIAQSSKSAPEVSKNGPEIALGRSDFEARRIKFAQPIVNVNYLPNESSIFSGGSSVNDMSTVLGGSAEMMNVTTSSLSCGELSMNQHITHENTVINAQSCDNREAILQGRLAEQNDEYGAHTFMRKKVQAPPTSTTAATSSSTVSTSTSTTTTSTVPLSRPTNIHTLVSSPKPFSKDAIGRSMFSPVHFTPKSTSSPKTQQAPPPTESVMSPSKSAALEGSVATTRRLQFEEKLKNSGANYTAPVPTPRHVAPVSAPILNTPHYHHAPQQKKNLFSQPPISYTPLTTPPIQQPLVATAPLPVQTQWRGQANTPVVQGARADEKTAGTVPLVGASVGKLKNLKSRWEFSSATGTPIHPDATEDSLIATAIKMKETAIPTRIGFRPAGRKGPSASSIHSQNQAENRNYDGYQEEEDDDDDDVFVEEDSVSGDNVATGDVADTSKFIDHAFGFIEGPGTDTPSPYRDAPLASHDNSMMSPLKTLRQKAEIIEEEEVESSEPEEEEEEEPPVEEDSEEDVTEVPNPRRYEEQQKKEEPPVYRQNDSQLAYSVSFYRKIQRDRVGESSGAQPLSSVSPSAPVASLTSPQKLRQLTSSNGQNGNFSSPGRFVETVKGAMERLQGAMKIEDKLVTQSQRALARAREEPSFRGSREEFEAQRAYLVHMEKYRAMAIEMRRIEHEGVKIIDGPRGTVSITQLTVNIDRNFVAQHIASAKKSEDVFYFIAILKYGEQVDVSKMVTSDGGLNRRGTLDFPTPLKLTAIPSDFRASVEIYGQQSMRESTTHEDKFKLKSSTLKPKSRGTFLGGGSTSSAAAAAAAVSANQSLYAAPPIGNSTNAITNDNVTNFQLLGEFSFDITCPGKYVYKLSNTVYPIAGEVQMKVKKHAVDGADILFRGFLSMYQRTNEGLGSWTRYWCVLENGEMKFWRQPEDEGTKGYLVLMDLSTCCRSEGASTVNDICPFPNSFHIDVWAPKDDPEEPRGIMQLRVMLAADTTQDLQKWLSVINSTSRQLCTWRNPIQ
ncbi:hypothetical protein GCK72_011073 [Caenorhabditis remanei]|uniref:PH domain-containing protein n=1 Tax=Caenorhabditis remanei TaxID=31234 RepID=A0A6A5H4L8_CAERE|nr:hypothetical protein GCK72_011073 [Caenorhabditis remanei]KAF1762810.1 hypothetical protein GCK72_011073 [Caenorhabditis remanei]